MYQIFSSLLGQLSFSVHFFLHFYGVTFFGTPNTFTFLRQVRKLLTIKVVWRNHTVWHSLFFLRVCGGLSPIKVYTVLTREIPHVSWDDWFLRYVYFKQGRYGESNIEKMCVINTITYIFLESPYPEVLPLIFIFKKIK